MMSESSVTFIHSLTGLGSSKINCYDVLTLSFSKYYSHSLILFFCFRHPPEDLPPRSDVLHPRHGDEAVDLVQGLLHPGPDRHHGPPPGQLQRKVEEVWWWVRFCRKSRLKLVYFRPVVLGPNGPFCPVIMQFGIKITILNYLHLTLNIFLRILHWAAGAFEAWFPLYVQKDLRDSVREELWCVYRLLQGSRDILWTWEYRPGGGAEEILCQALSKNVYRPQLPIQFWRKVSIERFTVHKPKTRG